jgi:RND family efflux transporter MFP subunit
MKARRVVGVLVLALVLIGGVMMVRNPQPESDAAAVAAAQERHPVELADVEVTRATAADRSSYIRISGSVQPLVRTRLNAKVSGTVSDLRVDVGDRVSKGDVIAVFDTRDLASSLNERKATLAATQAQLDVAQNTLNRTRQLSKSGYSARATLDQAVSEAGRLQAQLDAQKAQVETAEKALGDATIVAPFDGFIAARPVEQGQTVAINAEIASLVDLSTMEMSAFVPTSRIAEIAIGQSAQIQVEGLGERAFNAKVTRISPMAQENARTIGVFLTIDNTAQNVRGGMFATGTLRVGDERPVISLPASAIRKDENGTFVLLVNGQKLKRQSVELGASINNGAAVSITDGVQEGDVVVSAALPDLKPDTDVRLASDARGGALETN